MTISQVAAEDVFVRYASWKQAFASTCGREVVEQEASYPLAPLRFANRESFTLRGLADLAAYAGMGVLTASEIKTLAFEDAALLQDGVICVGGNVVAETYAPLPHANRLRFLEFWKSFCGGNVEVVAEYDGPLLALEQPGIENYGHWLIEMFPKLSPFLPAIRRGEVTLALPIRQRTSRATRETLALVGLDPDKVCWLPPGVVRVKRLLYTSPISKHLHHPGWVSPWAADVLGGWASGIEPGPDTRIFVSRQDAKRRLLANEDEIYDIVAPRGYRRVRVGDLSLEEQIATFKGARSIVGVFGASLTNLVFCRPKVGILMIAPNVFMDHFYWNLASLRQLEYWQINGSAPDLNADARPMTGLDFSLEVGSFKRFFATFSAAIQEKADGLPS